MIITLPISQAGLGWQLCPRTNVYVYVHMYICSPRTIRQRQREFESGFAYKYYGHFGDLRDEAPVFDFQL